MSSTSTSSRKHAHEECCAVHSQEHHEQGHSHAHDDHHDHGHDHHGHNCAHHDATEAGLKLRMALVLAAAVCLLIGGLTRWLRPEQGDVAALLSLVGAILAALPIFRDALAGLQSKASDNTDFYMNQFITLAVAACLVSGHYITGGVVAILLLVGHILEDRSMLGASDAIERLLDLSRTRARRVTADGKEEEIDADALRVGDRIHVRPGDTIPADGLIRDGDSVVNQASITGESIPVEVGPGAAVFAGTVNLTGLLRVEVTKTGGTTVLGRVQAIVSEASSTRAPIVRLTEEYARYYMPIILLVAGAVLYFTNDFSRAISVIIVSIPCTFVMAGPTAMVAALAAASRHGILLKSVRFFEAATTVDTVVFDKTGTLTTGQLRVVEVQPTDGLTRAEVLALAAGLEQHSTHPIAEATLVAAKKEALAVPQVSGLVEESGLGLSGKIDGQFVQMGRGSWLEKQGVVAPPPAAAFEAHSAVSLARAGKLIGTIYYSDTVRPETAGLRERLETEGMDHFLMLTGDRYGVAQDIARHVGFTDFQAECLPEEKLAAVQRLRAAGRNVLVVGDGVNDAPALASGNLSMAMGVLGSDVAIQTADITLMSSDLRRIPHFVQLARLTLGIVNQNIIGGLLFIAVALVLSSAGYIPPVAAAFVHELGAFFVIFNSARLLKFEGR